MVKKKRPKAPRKKKGRTRLWQKTLRINKVFREVRRKQLSDCCVKIFFEMEKKAGQEAATMELQWMLMNELFSLMTDVCADQGLGGHLHVAIIHDLLSALEYMFNEEHINDEIRKKILLRTPLETMTDIRTGEGINDSTHTR